MFTAILDSEEKKKAIEAYEAYFKTAFPYIETDERRTDEKLIDFLRKEVERGPLEIKPLDMGVRSRMASRRRRADPELLKRSGKILKKIGRTLE
jgi:hypothetical protein